MSVRMAELLMAVAMALLSIGFMVKSTDGLSIWWVPGKGPGSGVWPFWLSFLMLLSCIAIIIRWFLRATPQSRSQELFMDRHAVEVVGITVAALFLLILGSHYIGIYFSLFAFLFFYLRILGRHSWSLSIALTLGIPAGVFMLFEYALTIPLPKGGSERLFFPLYKLMYGKGPGIWAYVLAAALGALTLLGPHYLKLVPKPGTGDSWFDRDIVQGLGGGAAMILLLFGTFYIGIYLSLLVFELVVLKALGRRSWPISVGVALAVPLAVYLIFDYALGIPLPKGITAPLFG